MKGPTNTKYIVAVNEDGSYPLLRTSHMKNGHSHAEVQEGYLVEATVIPDGHIVPGEISNSLFLSHKKWLDIQGLTWQQVHDRWTW